MLYFWGVKKSLITCHVLLKLLFKLVLYAIFRLAINYKESETAEEKLDDIHSKCSVQFCKEIIVPSKDVFSKVIIAVFPNIKRKIRYKGKSKYIVYNLTAKVCDSALTETSDNFTIRVPEYCILKHYEGNTEIKFQTEFLINGEDVSHAICFSSDGNCQLQVLNHEVTLLFDVACNQNNIDGLLHVFSTLKICKGTLSKEQNDGKTKENKMETEIWESVLEKEMHDVRYRSKSCRKILSILVSSDVCSPCSSIQRMRKKRKLDVSKKATVVPLSLKQNVNLLNIDVETCKISNEPKTIKKDSSSKEKKNTKEDSSNDSKENENNENEFVDLTEQEHIDMEKILDIICSKGVPEEFRILLKSQLANAKSGLEKRQRRWDPKVISICLSLYCRSPQAYQDLSKCGMLILPSKRLLQY